MVNYVDAIAALIGAELARNDHDCDPELLRAYALLALAKGTAVDLEDVHDAWATWRAATNPSHPALVPFEALTPTVQALDAPYRDAICGVVLAAYVAYAGPYRRHEHSSRVRRQILCQYAVRGQDVS
jgi:hypothetical protein